MEMANFQMKQQSNEFHSLSLVACHFIISLLGIAHYGETAIYFVRFECNNDLAKFQ